MKEIKKLYGEGNTNIKIIARLVDLKDLKKTTNNLEIEKKTLLEMEEPKKIKLKIKKLRRTIKNLSEKKPIDFTEYVELQKEEKARESLVYFSN